MGPAELHERLDKLHPSTLLIRQGFGECGNLLHSAARWSAATVVFTMRA